MDDSVYKPLLSIKNQFEGINPLFNDALQDRNAKEEDLPWHEFHSDYMTDLKRQLVQQLDGMGKGYIARLEKGLQIRYIGGEPGEPEADIMILDPDPTRHKQGPTRLPQLSSTDKLGVAYQPIADQTLDPEHYGNTKPLNAIGIYKSDGTPVAWIELLSPSNKPGGSGHSQYLIKRDSLLRNRNIVLVEMDFLNQTPPAFAHHPDYTKHEPGSTPYRIVISDPRHLKPGQNLTKGDMMILTFGVDQPIPGIPIPLYGEDRVDLNAQTPYNKTYEESLYGKQVPIDYAYHRQPPHFQDYMEVDQQRLLRRLLTVNLAHHNGVSLDEIKAPLPIDKKFLDPLIAQYKEQPHEFVLPDDAHTKGWDIDMDM